MSQSESWIDAQIRKAEERGDFDDLPGSGKPIPGLGRRQDPNWWLKDYLKREKLEPPLPEPLALRKEIERLPETLATERSEQVVRQIVELLNSRIKDALRRQTEGLLIRIRAVDVEQTVADWRSRRESEGLPVRP
ncbi:MAG TPA: DUF1992 domain-containing protein [Microlunatus sp.]|nr:DUF1992 domain-containing protein [Microlunatus sp.]